MWLARGVSACMAFQALNISHGKKSLDLCNFVNEWTNGRTYKYIKERINKSKFLCQVILYRHTSAQAINIAYRSIAMDKYFRSILK